MDGRCVAPTHVSIGRDPGADEDFFTGLRFVCLYEVHPIGIPADDNGQM